MKDLFINLTKGLLILLIAPFAIAFGAIVLLCSHDCPDASYGKPCKCKRTLFPLFKA
jgi:hypothetical protein